MPCRARLADRGKSFKVSILIHSASLNDMDGPGLVQNQRPFVAIAVGDKTKETELGDWSKEKGQWCFREVITVEVNTTEEMSVVIDAAKRYNLYVASVSVNNQRVGELCFPVASILPRLRAEDRDADGLIYATPVLGYDITQDGKVTGRVYLSFETKSPPPSCKRGEADRCCGLSDGGFGMYRGEDESTTVGTPSDLGSDSRGW
eukprot:CAMPEP_0169113266 /NCGR_PEP_ID=MMETSP1015-20121227/28109_1 /TAXON_ID=342587 /ORGANISM="Karlodinium micrum, Strain CCMP2283" /LENGTH=203 /DNA_ID=CAMNT_0009175423 /DNA_START=173 /DNA_END=781 /DNA_ORIENTATION=-